MSQDQTPCIVTDSTADIPAGVARRLDITVIPCQIHMQGRTYLEGIDLNGHQLYQAMRAGATASTSQPAVGVFADFYRQALAGGRPVIAIHLGSGYSGLHSTATIAAREADPERVTVVDSGQVSMATGWVAIQAAEMAQQGRSLHEVLAAIRDMLPRLRLFALIDDLRALRRGGRVSWLASFVGQWLSVKPIIQVGGNKTEPVAKVRTFSRGIERLASIACQLAPIERLAVLHADAPARLEQLLERLTDLVPRERVLVTEAGAIVGAHAGPGALGFACVLGQRHGAEGLHS